MKDVSFFIIDLLLAVFYLLIMKKYMNAFFSGMKKNPFQYILWGIYFLMQFFFKSSPNLQPQFILVINILLIFSLCSIAYVGSWKKRCIFSLLVCASWMLVEIIIGLILEQSGLGHDLIVLAGSLLSEMCMFLFAVLAGQYAYKKSRRDIPLHYTVAILLVPLMSIYLIHNILLIANMYQQYAAFAVVAGFMLLMTNYVIFGIYEWMMQDAETKERNRLYEQQLELCSRQAIEREEFNLKMRLMKHDMKNHFTVLQGMLRNHDQEAADAYISNLLDRSAGNAENVARSGNIVVDSLVNHICAQARRDGIAFMANVFIPARLPFRNGDLSIVFGNLLENALDACRGIKDGKRFIELETSYEKEILLITVRNPYEGKRQRGHDGRMKTTKGDAYRHGLGLSSVEQALEGYRGDLQISDSDGVFQVTTVMYGSLDEL